MTSPTGSSDPRYGFPDVFTEPEAKAWIAGYDAALAASREAPTCPVHGAIDAPGCHQCWMVNHHVHKAGWLGCTGCATPASSGAPDPDKARYNESYGLAPGACNCHHGSARWCPIHTQADFDATGRASSEAERLDEVPVQHMSWPGQGLEPATWIGADTVSERDRLAALDVGNPRRTMVDGTPCWCVSEEEPHEGWVHAPVCIVRREIAADPERRAHVDAVKATLRPAPDPKHCPGCGGWVSTHSGQGEGYECPGVHLGEPRDLDAAMGAALLNWYDHTHGNEFGHDHHCPVPWNESPHTQEPDDRCTCGWSDVLVAARLREPTDPTITQKAAAMATLIRDLAEPTDD